MKCSYCAKEFKSQGMGSHILNKHFKKNGYPIPLEDILVENSSYKNQTSIKNRLFKCGLKEKEM